MGDEKDLRNLTMEIGCQSTCGLSCVPEDIFIFFNDPSREPYQTVSTVYSLKKDGKERGAKMERSRTTNWIFGLTEN